MTLGGLVKQHSDTIKGILVLLVVMDHNDWLRAATPELFRPLTFHVLGFFFLAFAFAEKRLSVKFALDRACRYLVPFWWMLLLTSLIYSFVLAKGITPMSQILAVAAAAIIGNAPFVKASSGLLMLWFLPALLGLNLLIAAYDEVNKSAVRWLLAVAAFAVHLMLPLLNVAQLMWLPLGLGIALEVFVLGLAWRYALTMRLTASGWLLVATLWAGSYAILVAQHVNVEIATLDVYGITHPQTMVLQDLEGFLGVAMVIWLAQYLSGINLLKAIGRRSMLVYLIHPLVYQASNVVLPPNRLEDPNWLTLCVGGAVTGVAATVIAYWLAVGIEQSPTLSSWLTPRYFSDWPPVRQALLRN